MSVLLAVFMRTERSSESHTFQSIKGEKLPWTLPGRDWQYATACRYQTMRLATGLVTYCVSIDAFVCPEMSEPERTEGFRMVSGYQPVPDKPI